MHRQHSSGSSIQGNHYLGRPRFCFSGHLENPDALQRKKSLRSAMHHRAVEDGTFVSRVEKTGMTAAKRANQETSNEEIR